MRWLAIFLLSLGLQKAFAQLSLRDTARSFDKIRLTTNAKGAYVLGCWGATNLVAGGTGYFVAKDDKMKYFWGMNAAWGAVNTTLARIMFKKQFRDARHFGNMQTAYQAYRKDIGLYRLNVGLDVAYIGIGAAMVNFADKNSNPQMLKGFGGAIALQGFMLFLFDDVMLFSHNKMSGKWAQILDEGRFSYNGLGINYTLAYRYKHHSTLLLH